MSVKKLEKNVSTKSKTTSVKNKSEKKILITENKDKKQIVKTKSGKKIEIDEGMNQGYIDFTKKHGKKPCCGLCAYYCVCDEVCRKENGEQLSSEMDGCGCWDFPDKPLNPDYFWVMARFLVKIMDLHDKKKKTVKAKSKTAVKKTNVKKAKSKEK
ncbi:MAG TPA: hypothetical protein PKY81_07370 [bacterium]|nr:hypothetical protein [bacterium]